MANVSMMPASLSADKSPEEIAWLQSIEKLGNTLNATLNSTVDGLATYSKIIRDINPQTGTSYTLTADDSGYLVTLNNASAITLTVPSGLPENCQIDLAQLGAGQVSVVASGVTIISEDSKVKLLKQGSAATLVQVSANVFLLTGSLSL